MTTEKTDIFTHSDTITRSQGELNSSLIQRDIDYFLNRLESQRAYASTGTRNPRVEAQTYAALRGVWERIAMSYLALFGTEEFDKLETMFEEGTYKGAMNAWKVLRPFLYVKGLMQFDSSTVIDFSDLEEVNERYGH